MLFWARDKTLVANTFFICFHIGRVCSIFFFKENEGNARKKASLYIADIKEGIGLKISSV